MKWTIRNKILTGFGIVVVQVFALAIINWGVASANIEAIETARDKGYAGAILAAGIKYDAGQVWQWLTDISATRAAEGFDDGFDQAEVYAKRFRQDIAELRVLYPDKREDLDKLEESFEAFYEKGRWMAGQYVAGGSEAGNQAMQEFDAYAEDITAHFFCHGAAVKRRPGHPGFA